MMGAPSGVALTVAYDGEGPATYTGNDEIVVVHPGATITWPA